MKKIYLSLFIVLNFCFGIVYSQNDEPKVDLYFPFIQYQQNTLQHYNDSVYFSSFYKKLELLNFKGEGQINIVHIGGSHVQADVFTNQMRKHFQSFQGGMNSGRGFVFPYKLAKTNTSSTYQFTYTGNWESCRNVDKNKFCKLGVGGITAVTYDSISSLTFSFRKSNAIVYDFNKLKILHELDSTEFSIRFDSLLVKKIIHHPDSHYTEVFFNYFLDSVCVEFVKTDSNQTHFTLFGFVVETDESGIFYHNLGINGASVSSFLNTSEFESQLKLLKPDLIILGLGINDAYSKEFSDVVYMQNYNELIRRIRISCPDAAIIFITNNDSYLYRKKVNKNGILVQASLKYIANENGAAVWDLFDIMGGLNSITKWQKYGLANRDKVHFTREGYQLIGDLFFEAIIASYFDYLTLNYHSTMIQKN